MSSKKQLLFILVAVAGAILAYTLIRALTQNDESRVRRAVYAGILAVEKMDPAKCATFISDAYEDASGNDKAAVLRFLSDVFKDFKDFKVVIKKLQVKTKGNEAFGNVWFICYFRKPGEDKLYYDSGKIELWFTKENKSWRVKKIEYSGSNELLFLHGVA